MHTLEEFKHIVLECVKKADDLYGTEIASDLQMSFNLRGQTAGYAGWVKSYPSSSTKFHYARAFSLKFNPDAISKHWDDMINSTIPHEIAHLVDASLGYFSNHRDRWQKIAIELGDVNYGNRCHSFSDLKPGRVTQKFEYTSEAGTKIHSRIQSGYGTYHCRKTNTPLIRNSAKNIR